MNLLLLGAVGLPVSKSASMVDQTPAFIGQYISIIPILSTHPLFPPSPITRPPPSSSLSPTSSSPPRLVAVAAALSPRMLSATTSKPQSGSRPIPKAIATFLKVSRARPPTSLSPLKAPLRSMVSMPSALIWVRIFLKHSHHRHYHSSTHALTHPHTLHFLLLAGCVVPWNNAENKFMCPCHGSQYNNQGKVVRGPAPLSLALAHCDVVDDVVTFSPWTETDFRTGLQPWWK